MIQAHIFEPLLKQFCTMTKPVEMHESFSSVFLPNVMKNYFAADRKVFYFGRDTAGWSQTKVLMRAFDENKLCDYFDKTNSWMEEFGFLDYNNNKSSAFWTLAMRLHLRLKGVTENLIIGPDLPDEYYELISDFGWGNTNSIEVQKSLEKQGLWEHLDKEKYWKVKEESKIFNKLSHTIQAYIPDLVFIFNWECDSAEFLQGLNYQERRLSLINDHFWTYDLPDTGTKVIWTLHPTGAMYQGYSANTIIDEIIQHLENES